MSFKKFFEGKDLYREYQLANIDVFKYLKKNKISWFSKDEILKQISENSKEGKSYSKGSLDLSEINKQLIESGLYYAKTEVNISDLIIPKQTEEVIRNNEFENPNSNEDEAPPIVVGIVDGVEMYVIDGRHRVINKKNNNVQTIEAFVPLQIYGKLNLKIGIDEGIEAETGKPITIKYMKNLTPSPKNISGDPYQQKIEPHGNYISYNEGYITPDQAKEMNMELGEVTFNNPLVMEFNTSGESAYDETSWKARLVGKFKKKGKALSRHLIKLGHDGIITYDKYGYTEIVSFKNFI
jgi:hypothetical protein